MQRKQLGIASIEYALLTGLLVIAAVSGVVMIQNTSKGFFSNTISQLGDISPATTDNTASTHSAIIIQSSAEVTTQQQQETTIQPVASTSIQASTDFDDALNGHIELNQHTTDITGSSTEMSTSDALSQTKRPRQIVADAAAAVNQSGLLFTWKTHSKKTNEEDEAETIESIHDISTKDVTQLGQF